MDKNAKWIWINGDKNLYSFVKFRKLFDYDCGDVYMDITADSRYYLYINGEFLNFGPVRCYPAHYKFDTLNITPYLKKGKNVLAVLVYKFGQDNFQYIKAKEGLAISVSGGVSFTSDSSFKCAFANEYNLNTPEISVQQPFEEQVDGNYIDNWAQLDYNDSAWENSRENSKDINDGSHFDLSNRGIPLLTLKEVYPKRFIESVSVQKPKNVISFDLRQPFKEYVKYDHTGFLFNTCIVLRFFSSKSAVFSFKYKTLYGDYWLNGKLNSQKLIQGENVLYYPLPTYAHSVSHSFIFDTDSNIEHIKLFLVGPYELSADEIAKNTEMGFYQNISKRITAGDEKTVKNFLQDGDLTQAMPFLIDVSMLIHSRNVFAERYCDKVLGKAAICNETAIVSGNEYFKIPKSDTDTRILVDFGEEVVGFIEFEVFATAKTTIDFHNFEFIQPDKRRNYAEGMNNTMSYTVKNGYQKYRSIIRRGLRYSYLTVAACSEDIFIKGFKIINSVYPQQNKGDFICSDWKLNRIYECGKETLRCCMEDTYTDCPTYEQTHWVGDARNEALVDWVVNGDNRLWYRCLEQVAQSLDISKITLSQVPSGWYNILPTWSFLWMRSICEYYLYTGDKKGTITLFNYLDKNIEGIKTYINEFGLFEIVAWNMFDWAAMDTPSNGIVIHQNCTLVQSLNDSANLAESLGKTIKAAEWRKLAILVKDAINKHAYSDKNNAYTDCLRRSESGLVKSNVYSQQTQSTAVSGKVAEGIRLESAKEYMVSPPKFFITSGSPFFEFFLLENLMKNEDTNAFIDLIRKDWGFMVDKGSSTFWEMWTFIQPDGRLTRSHCHGWSAAPVYFLTEYILGVMPLEAGYKKVSIKPHCGDLEWARGSVPTPLGLIEVDWENKNGKLILNVNAPDGIEIVE